MDLTRCKSGVRFGDSLKTLSMISKERLIYIYKKVRKVTAPSTINDEHHSVKRFS